MDALPLPPPTRPAIGKVLIVAGVVALLLALGIGAALVSFAEGILEESLEIRAATARADVTQLAQAVEEFARGNVGRYPETLEDLATPDAHGRRYLRGERVPLDPWGRPYVYVPPRPEARRAVVRSFGRDGRPGGEGPDADVASH